ncbi:MAG: hypothetical protein ABFR33_06370 [Verrucomicrobiota bacterium]
MVDEEIKVKGFEALSEKLGLVEQSGLADLARASVAALLHRDVFVSGFATHLLHPPCIQSVILCESTNPFRPRPIGRFGVI